MTLAERLIRRPLYAWLLVIGFGVGGVLSYSQIGRLEDPNFAIKTALVVAQYPGASVSEVEKEVTEKLESAIQKMDQVDYITSRSLPGYAEIKVEILDRYSGKELPEIWDVLRSKVDTATKQLPPNAGPVIVNDDFGDVYGIYYAVTGSGYTPAQLNDYLRDLRRDLLLVDGVAAVDIQGDQQEQIVVELDQATLVANNLQAEDIYGALAIQNQVQSAGNMRISDLQVRVTPDQGYSSVEAVGSVPISSGPSPLILADIATIYRSYDRHPQKIIRFNGQPALTIGISGLDSVNIVDVGERVEQRMAELEPLRPIGIKLHPLYKQHQVVDEAVSGFVLNVAGSISIVLVVLCLSLGWRSGVVLAIVLSLTISGTIMVMYLTGITLQRISLGTLIIVMGMLADNAIVICEGMQVKVEAGKRYVEAAGEILEQTQWSLLGATVVGILAFSGIGLSPDSVGDYCFSLFAVAAISLLLSWIIAVGVTPLFGAYLLKKPKGKPEEPFSGGLYQRYRGWLRACLKYRIPVVVVLVLLTVACGLGFKLVKQSFFPASSTPLFYVDMRFPKGTDIQATSDYARKIETWLQQQSYVEHVATYIGGGAERFILVYDPQTPDPTYVQFIVRVNKLKDIDPHRPQLESWLVEHYPQAQVEVLRPSFGPGGGADIEYRISGPDPDVLRELGQQVKEKFTASGRMTAIHDDWGMPTLGVRAVVNDSRARAVGVTRPDIAHLLAYASDGMRAGVYRENDQLLPIMVRSPDRDDVGIEHLKSLQIYSPVRQSYIPITDVVDNFVVISESAERRRRDRVHTLTVSANVLVGENITSVFNDNREQIEATALPFGYRAEWGGQKENSSDALENLSSQIPLSFLTMVAIVMLMFGRLKPAMVVLLIVPMSICGLTLGLLLTGGSFGFMALLGFLSLFGMLIKNAIVLVEEIERQINQGTPRFKAIIDGSQSRLRPVALAAGTTILGMIPLLWDPFFVNMAITIMGGLAFATLLTMFAVPVFYALFFHIRTDEC